MSYPKLNSENNQILGNLTVEPEFKILTESKKIEFKINSFLVESNPRMLDLIKKENQTRLYFECDTTLANFMILFHVLMKGGKIKSHTF